MNKLVQSSDQFTNLSKDPSVFLTCKREKAQEFLDICTTLYAFVKSFNKLPKEDPFANLLVCGFDDEQIWQQIDSFNAYNMKMCSKRASLCLNNWVQLCPNLNEQENHDESDDENASEDDADEEDTGSEKVDNLLTNNVQLEKKAFEKSEVDDEFFSLRQMEKFLETEESKTKLMNSDDDVDYFNDIPLTDDENTLFKDDDAFSETSFDDFKFDENNSFLNGDESDDFFYFYFIYFISIFILLNRRKATEALIHRVGNYPDLLSEIPRYCYPLVVKI